MIRNNVRAGLASFALLALVATAVPGLAETQVKPGFNVFSVEQDVEIGRQSASEAERQLPLLNDRSIDSYVNGLVRELAATAPGAKFPYQAKVVNATEINAFALPGGFLYVNRGLMQSARTEGELAGVVAHEIAHIALRHGTHNASKAYMAQAGLGVLGGILTRGKTRSTQDIVNAIGGLGLNAVFLKYSRDAETQADIVGAQLMARAGYDPLEMVSFFELLQQQQKGNPGRVASFFASHPAPANRAARIRQEAQIIGASGIRRASSSRDFQSVRQALGGQPAPRSSQQVARRGVPPQTRRSGGRQTVQVEAPSSRFVTYRQRDDFFTLQHPENWRAYPSENGFGVTIVPEGGVVDGGNGQESIVYGVIVNHYDPFENQAAARRMTLDQATSDLLTQIRSTNSHLRVGSRNNRQVIDGQPGRSVVLTGTSPVTGQEERVALYTREMGDGHIVYSLAIAPGRDYEALSDTFWRMMDSLQVNDEAAHSTGDRDR
jgi:beta-barrel assembly-enhancing protease